MHIYTPNFDKQCYFVKFDEYFCNLQVYPLKNKFFFNN